VDAGRSRPQTLGPKAAGSDASDLFIDAEFRHGLHLRVCVRTECTHFSLIGADFDVLVLARTPDNDALREVVMERIQGIPGVRSTRTWLVFDESPGHGVDWT
jgi:hypothetical protein